MTADEEAHAKVKRLFDKLKSGLSAYLTKDEFEIADLIHAIQERIPAQTRPDIWTSKNLPSPAEARLLAHCLLDIRMRFTKAPPHIIARGQTAVQAYSDERRKDLRALLMIIVKLKKNGQ